MSTVITQPINGSYLKVTNKSNQELTLMNQKLAPYGGYIYIQRNWISLCDLVGNYPDLVNKLTDLVTSDKVEVLFDGFYLTTENILALKDMVTKIDYHFTKSVSHSAVAAAIKLFIFWLPYDWNFIGLKIIPKASLTVDVTNVAYKSLAITQYDTSTPGATVLDTITTRTATTAINRTGDFTINVPWSYTFATQQAIAKEDFVYITATNVDAGRALSAEIELIYIRQG